MAVKVTVDMVMRHEFIVYDDYAEDMNMTTDEAVKYEVENLRVYGEDRLYALERAQCKEINVIKVENYE